nr:OFA family MFS transporter [uncultured Bacillus sp.]
MNTTMASNLQLPRWRILIAAMFVNLCIGTNYAFSVWSGPLAEARGWTMGEVILAFTINMAIAPIPMIWGGKIVDKGGAKTAFLIGGSLYGAGFILTSFVTSVPMLYLSYGVLCGFGQAFAYSGALGNTQRLFPDKRGLATGLVTAANGGAAMITAPLITYLIGSQGSPAALRYMGIIFLVVCIICGLLTKAAPTGYVPAGWTPPQANTVNAGAVSNDVHWKKLFSNYRFYIILAIFGIGTLSGLMIVSHASTIGQSMFGLSAAVAAFYVSMYSLSNCLGRLFWGTVSDKIGRYWALATIFLVISSMLLVLATAESSTSFAIAIIGMGLCFGGVMGIVPSVVVENFGAKFYGVNYGIIFSGYAIAAFFGPKIGASIAGANNGDFTRAFFIAMVCGFFGLALTVLLISINKSKLKKSMTEAA